MVLPRKRQTGLNVVMEVLAREVGADVQYVDTGAGYCVRRVFAICREMRSAKARQVWVHSSGIVPDLLNVLTGQRYASTTLHNYLSADYVLQYGKWKGALATIVHLMAMRLIPVRLSCGESVRRHVWERYRLATVACANGCRAPTRRDGHGGRQAESRAYFFAGPFIKRKNVPAAIAAITELDPTAAVCAFGDGPDAAAIEKIRSGRPNVSMRRVEDPTAHYATGDFYISFSRFEGLPLAVLEAIRCGCIPILSDIEPHREVLRLVDLDELRCFSSPREGVAWAVEMTPERRRALGRAVMARANEAFSERAFAARFRAAFEGVARTA
jgi:glycosyltransferase involved in cell wall biosynthesis